MCGHDLEEEIEKIKLKLQNNRPQLLYINENFANSHALCTVIRIRQIQEKSKVTYETIANLASVDKSYIGLLVKGERRPPKYIWFRIGILYIALLMKSKIL